MRISKTQLALTMGLVVVLTAGVLLAFRLNGPTARTTVTAYFENSNGLFVGDDVLILGVPVGKVSKIEPQPERAKVTFWVDTQYKVPAEVTAAILSPQLVTGRAIQLTPPYESGPELLDNAVVPIERTAVPVSWDDFRVQLEKLTRTLQPQGPGGTSALGNFINTAADNLRGEGANIHDALLKLSKTVTTLSDHKDDVFSTLTNLATLVSALHDSTDVLSTLNHNLAAVSALLSDSPDEVGQAMADLSALAVDVKSFVADNREAVGTTSDTAASISTALVQSLDDIKQSLHIFPTTLANFGNIYEPASGSLTGALAVNNFSDPISFICGAVEAASRLGAEQSAKLCVQYLAPIVKNRQFNFPPFGENAFVGAQARPNEVTYSQDWLRPDYIPPAGSAVSVPEPAALPAEAAPPDHSTDPAAGLPGLMIPTGAGS
ncbi:MCE family protein [Mycolicibacterium boenickei]|uniref:MCE family protein n=1 Tax=Mycolicibacterium boenickei TaxID=146017 RepID=A0AAX2ZT48_9MYCO|nr:MCE family protein [Mycolicibacterium boenickei]PEG62643.1 mammalian cell entry protein [Mycolicibacterium boenickei]UNB98363.1 MCE family protein [Mycolicibacterium boenickei]BBX94155.1 mammalian cell entry protein [Mycolicibacterium boenickei]